MNIGDLVSSVLCSCLVLTLCIRVYLALPESSQRIRANWGATVLPTPVFTRVLQVIMSVWKTPGPVVQSDWKPLRLEYENVRAVPTLLDRMNRFRGDSAEDDDDAVDDLPFFYFHAFTFPAVLELMLHRQFPASALGSVLLDTAITSWITLRTDEEFHVRVRLPRWQRGNFVRARAVLELPRKASAVQVAWEGIRPHHRGFLADVVVRVRPMHHVRTAWQSRTTILCFGVPTCPRAMSPTWDPPRETLPDREIPFLMEANAGRLFSGINGDFNPIHLYDWSAKLLGFPRAMAHGMGVAERIIGPLVAAAKSDAVLAERVRGCAGTSRAHFVATFRKPLWIPSGPTLRMWITEDETTAACDDAERAWAQEFIGARGIDADRFSIRGVVFEVRNGDALCQTGALVLAKSDTPLVGE